MTFAKTTEKAFTCYGASTFVNELLKAKGFSKTIRPQMLYNYTTARVNKGEKPFIPITDGLIKKEDLEAWLDKYIARNLKK